MNKPKKKQAITTPTKLPIDNPMYHGIFVAESATRLTRTSRCPAAWPWGAGGSRARALERRPHAGTSGYRP